MMNETKVPEKKERLLAALDRGMAMVHLDARRPGVLVPPALKNEPHLLLNLSYRFDPPDLSVNDWGVRSTLTFGGSRFTVAIPWSALYAVSSHVTKEFWMYPEDMPQELIDQARAATPAPLDGADGASVAATAPEPAKARRKLREVRADRTAPALSEVATEKAARAEPAAPVQESSLQEPAPRPTAEEPAAPRSRSHLRLVK